MNSGDRFNLNLNDNKRQYEELMVIENIFFDTNDRRNKFIKFTENGFLCGKFTSMIDLQEPITLYLPEYEHTVDIYHLPHVTLIFELPHTYPSRASPSFTISCSWLNFQELNKISNHLIDLWCQTKSEIIYKWLLFIKDDVVNFLKKKTTNFHFSSNEILHKVLYFNGIWRDHLKKKTLKECPICFEEFPLKDFFIQKECEHFACLPCVKLYYESLINDDFNCDKVTCTQTDCECEVDYYSLKQILKKETFDKYDQSMLKFALDGMSDVQTCPMLYCNNVVIIDTQSGIGICSVCSFAFCANCKKSTHGFDVCTPKNENYANMLKNYLSSDEDGKLLLEKKHGRKLLRKLLEDNKSNEFINKQCKQCPTCMAFIEKMDGCNKMVCRRCRTFFCWLCLNVLSRNQPYLHYQDPNNEICFNKLFLGVDEGNFEQLVE